MIPRSRTSPLSSGFFTTFATHSTSVFSSGDPRRPSLLSTPTLTGLVVRTRDTLRPAALFSWETTLSPGLPSGNSSSPARVPRLSTAPWPTVWPRCLGCANFSYSFTFTGQLLSTATTSMRCTSPPTPFRTNARSMLRSISVGNV
jgi:hypothetical protein